MNYASLYVQLYAIKTIRKVPFHCEAELCLTRSTNRETSTCIFNN